MMQAGVGDSATSDKYVIFSAKVESELKLSCNLKFNLAKNLQYINSINWLNKYIFSNLKQNIYNHITSYKADDNLYLASLR